MVIRLRVCVTHSQYALRIATLMLPQLTKCNQSSHGIMDILHCNTDMVVTLTVSCCTYINHRTGELTFDQ